MQPWPQRLFLNRAFGVFWVGQSLSTLGDAFAFVALPLLVLEATGSVRQMGLLTATFGVGQIVAGTFSGAIVDSVDRRRLMIACDVVRAVLYATVPLAWIVRGPSIPLLYVVTALGAITGNLFSVGYVTAIANLVPPSELTRANSRLQASQALGFVLGPTLAGIIAARVGPSAAVGLDAASFLVSAASLLMIRLRNAEREPEQGFFRKLGAGVAYLVRQKVLRSVTLVLILTSMCDGGLFDLFIYLVKHDLRRSDVVVGTVMGVGAVGAVAGALVAPAVRRRWGFGACFLGATAVEALAMMAMGITGGLVAAAALAIAFSAAMSLRGVSSISLRQQITPDHLLGRVTAAFWTLVATMMPVGAAVSTAVAASWGTRRVICACGVLIGVVAALGFLTPARQAHPERSA